MTQEPMPIGLSNAWLRDTIATIEHLDRHSDPSAWRLIEALPGLRVCLKRLEALQEASERLKEIAGEAMAALTEAQLEFTV